MSEFPQVAIVGPTGSGKSDLSLRVAEAFNGEIVNCDSLQIFRHFDIGTAKIPLEARHGIPHHLIDIVNPDEIFTAGEYAGRARPLLMSISRRALPVIAGGTGFYLRALLDGLFPAPARDAGLRAALEAREGRRKGSLHRLLRRFDPRAAEAIHPNDTPKVIRALEVFLLTRRPLTSWFREGRIPLSGFRTLKIGLAPPRDILYRRLDERCRQMFDGGLIEEVEHILGMGWPETSKPFESHGYRQVLRMVKGAMKREPALAEAQTNTRHYSKRQMTWFRKEPGVEWFEGFGDDPAVQKAVLERVFTHINHRI